MTRLQFLLTCALPVLPFVGVKAHDLRIFQNLRKVGVGDYIISSFAGKEFFAKVCKSEGTPSGNWSIQYKIISSPQEGVILGRA